MADITGPQGIRGPQGEKGDTVVSTITVTGARGPQGEKGDTIVNVITVTGARGPQGEKGENLIILITGPQGYQGRQGVIGYQGVVGDTGAQGNQGFQGDQGFQGYQGFQGDTIIPTWGNITGTLSNQTDVQDELDSKPVHNHRHTAGVTDTDPLVVPEIGTLNFFIGSVTGFFYNNDNFAGILYEANIPEANLTVTDNIINYVYAEYNGTSAEYKVTTNVDLINESNTIPINTMLVSNGYVHLSHWDRMADGMTNKLHRRLVKTQRYVKEPGSGLTISSDGTSISEGVVWRGARDFHLNEMTFGGAQDFWFHYYDTGNGNWTYNFNTEPYNNSQYNNRTTGLVTLTDTYYTINWMYRGVEDHSHAYYVLGDKEYKDRPTALAESVIPTLPLAVTSHAILIGRIIVQKGSTDLIVELGSGDSFTGAVINDHNELSGLNTGNYQHLTQSEYNYVVEHNHEAGFVNEPDIIPIGDGSFYVSTADVWFFSDINRDTLTKVSVVEGGVENPIVPADDTVNYVCACSDGVWRIMELNQIDYISCIPYFIAFKRLGSTSLHTQRLTPKWRGEIEDTHKKQLECGRYNKANDALLGLVVNPDLSIEFAGGGVWSTNRRYEILPVTTDTTHHELESLGGGIWVLNSEHSPSLNNTYYNGPTGYVSLDDTKWGISYIFRGIEDQDHMYSVQGSTQYDTSVLAQASNSLSSVPPMIEAHAMFVGRVIFEKGATSDFICEGAFDTVFAASTPISEHNTLSDKQGGQTGEFYHLTNTEHSVLTGVGGVTGADSLHIHPHDHDGLTIQPDVVLFNTPAVIPTGVGSTYWDDTYKCLATKTSADTTLQHGQELVIYCHNDSDVNISNGEVVYSVGGGDRVPTIALAHSDLEYTSYTLGVATQAIDIGQYGFITVLGNVNGISTDGSTASETWNEGDTLYLSLTAGKMTNVKPVAPLHISRVGRITFKDNSDGTIFVQPSTGYELDELHDVLIVTGTAGNTLVRDVSGLWRNHTITQSDVGLGNVDNTSDLDKPLSNAVTGALELKVDKVTGASLMYDIDRDRLANTTGNNTGDQDLSGLVTKTTTVNGYQLTGPIQLVNTDISGVEFVDNTSDLDKPLSNAVTGALALKVPFTTLTDTKAWTGFIDTSLVDIHYNYNDATVVLIGDLGYYWRGVYHTLESPWTSPPHSTGLIGNHYLYMTDGVDFNWHYNDGWDIPDMQIVRVNYKGTEAESFGIRETHGVMDPTVHGYLHDRFKSYCSGGGNPLNVDVETYTDLANAVEFDGASITDEDLTTYIDPVSGSYTLTYIVNNEMQFDLGSPLPFKHDGSFIQYNDTLNGVMVDGVDGRYYNVYQILVPVTSDAPSQSYRMVFLQPQRSFDTLLSAQLEPASTLSIPNIGTVSSEYVIHTRITFFTKEGETNSGMCCVPANGISTVGVLSSQMNNHSQMDNLNWSDSGHQSDTPNTVAGFDNLSSPSLYSVSGINNILVTTNSPIWDSKADLVGGKVPITQLPEGSLTYEEYPTYNNFPGNVSGPVEPPSTSVVYTALDTSLSYRWSGSIYVISSSALVLGETSETAYRGDRGKTAYDHSQIIGGGATGTNPHGTTYSEVGAAPSSKGVTNGDSHDHNGGDGGQIAYGTLSGLPSLGSAASTSSSDYAPANQGVSGGNSHDHLGGDGGTIDYNSITGLPSLGTAAAKNIPAAGDASVTEVVYGTDTRLTDARNPLSHSQAESTITFTDVTTGDSTTGAHGYFPKLPTPVGNYLRDDMSWQTLTNSTVGLGNVTNNAQYYLGGQIIPVTDGGLGVGTITGIIKGAGTGPVETAIPLVDYALPSQYGRVVTTNATTTGQTLTDITGMTVTLEANTVYEISVTMTCLSSSNAGNRYGVQFTGAGATIEASIIGMAGNATTNRNERISAFNTQTGIFLGSSGTPGGVRIGGVVQTGVNGGTLSIRHLKETSGTATVYINSFLKVSKIA